MTFLQYVYSVKFVRQSAIKYLTLTVETLCKILLQDVNLIVLTNYIIIIQCVIGVGCSCCLSLGLLHCIVCSY